jgi:hypothetical protein
MKFNSIDIMLALGGVSIATFRPDRCSLGQCSAKRSIGLTSKPREWINTIRGINGVDPVEIDFNIRE